MPKYDYSQVMVMFNEADTGAKNKALQFTEITTYFTKKGIEFDKVKAKEVFDRVDLAGQKGKGKKDHNLQLDEFEEFCNELFP
ncbi:EF-hand_domain pair [Hexamita inflata]|uniref:EF-hand domain pair n=1 Tax=Hexamita inflata TaxID=28002 RepID=A0AA86PY64_9EUKA|nr:EF-hand domain pair [Hexamita inflata]CAI9948226.1 EF-hand domain pair [Hexamita inflata]